MALPINGALGLILRHLTALVTAPYELKELIPRIEAGVERLDGKLDKALETQGKHGERIAHLEGRAEGAKDG